MHAHDLPLFPQSVGESAPGDTCMQLGMTSFLASHFRIPDGGRADAQSPRLCSTEDQHEAASVVSWGRRQRQRWRGSSSRMLMHGMPRVLNAVLSLQMLSESKGKLASCVCKNSTLDDRSPGAVKSDQRPLSVAQVKCLIRGSGPFVGLCGSIFHFRCPVPV